MESRPSDVSDDGAMDNAVESGGNINEENEEISIEGIGTGTEGLGKSSNEKTLSAGGKDSKEGNKIDESQFNMKHGRYTPAKLKEYDARTSADD